MYAERVKTTQRYTRMARKDLLRIRSSLDKHVLSEAWPERSRRVEGRGLEESSDAIDR